jgi:hypothetical protein
MLEASLSFPTFVADKSVLFNVSNENKKVDLSED